ncbi:MAG: SipW-dependent-type signal peptide-containing protein [Leucobacter sp.]
MALRDGRRSHRRRRDTTGTFTKVRALLAGALVLGVGGSMTLAAWTDTETAQGTFAASKFGIQGSTDAATFADHPASAPAALSFAIAPTAMSPGTTTYARFVVRTTTDTTVPGSVALGGATVTGTGLGAYLKYGVRTVPAGSQCTSATYASGTVVVAADSALSAAAGSAQALAAAGGAPVTYCFAVTLPDGTPNAAQGLTATATWTFTGTSSS